jgi:hypothetical protein
MDAIAAGAAPCASTDTVPDPRLAAYTVPPSVHADADDLKRYVLESPSSGLH